MVTIHLTHQPTIWPYNYNIYQRNIKFYQFSIVIRKVKIPYSCSYTQTKTAHGEGHIFSRSFVKDTALGS